MELFQIPENVETFVGTTETERWIREVIEYDIMDPAWFEVLRRHPEVQVDSDGNAVTLPRNHNIKKFTKVSHPIICENLVTSLCCDDDFVFEISTDSSLTVRDQKSSNVVSQYQLRSEERKLPPPLGLPTCHLLPGTFFCLKAQSTNVTGEVVENVDNEQELVRHRKRMVLLTVDLFIETVDANPAPKKGKDKNAPLDAKPRTFMKYRVVVVDVYADSQSAFIETVFDWYIVGDNQPSFENFSASSTLVDTINCSLSSDNRVLSLVQRENTGSLCSLFDLSDPKPPRQRSDVSDDSSTPSTAGVLPPLIAQFKVDNIIQNISLVLLPTQKKDKDSTATAASAADEDTARLTMDYYEKNILIILSILNNSFLPVLRLTKKPVEAPTNAKASKPPPKGAPEVPPPPAVFCIPKEFFRLRLPSPPSAIATAVVTKIEGKDGGIESVEQKSSSKTSDRSQVDVYVAVGHMNGLITLWNLLENVCLSTIAQHNTMTTVVRNADGLPEKKYVAAAISCIQIVPASSLSSSPHNQQNNNHHNNNVLMLIAGAVDGTLSFHSSAGSTFSDLHVNAPQFHDFRHDVFEDTVLDIRLFRRGMAGAGLCFITHHASGTCLLYKIYRGRQVLLISSLSLDERVDFRNIQSAFVSVDNVPSVLFQPAEDLLNPPPPPEPVAPAAAKAAKGKEVIPAPEPEPEPTEEELAAKAAEEARVRAETYKKMMLGIGTSSYSMKLCIEKVRQGYPLAGRCGITAVGGHGRYWCALSRDGGAAVARFEVAQFVLAAMDNDELLRKVITVAGGGGGDGREDNGFGRPSSSTLLVDGGSSLLQESTDNKMLLIPPSSRQPTASISKVRSSLPISSSSSSSIKPSKPPAGSASVAGGTLVPPSSRGVTYKQLKLTEHRLHAHEQQLAETKRGIFDGWHSRSIVEDVSQADEEALVVPEGPAVVDPVFAAKGEILKMKKDKLKARPNAFAKTMATLTTLCS